MKILGILNITEDSFSDGGKFLAPEAALAHADSDAHRPIQIHRDDRRTGRPTGSSRSSARALDES